MLDKFFLDTNIIIYSLDPNAPSKRVIAEELLERALKGDGCISPQVVQESLNHLTSRGKHLLQATDASHFLDIVLEPLTVPLPVLPLYRDALGLRERWRFGFYDALIIAAALRIGCDRLYSEDLQHGQRIENLTVINPFA